METPLANRELNQVELSIFSEMLSKRQAKDKSYKRLKCAIYARKSQVDEKDSSLPTQISFCQSVIKSVDFLEETYIFKEDNVSGMNTQNRVEFNKMFELVNNRQIDVIIVYKSDRFSRNAIDAGRYREIARKKDVYVLACDEVIDTTTPTGHFCQTVMWATTELYAREGAERTLLAMSNRAKNGVYVSGKPPIGYTKSSTGKLTIDINESVIVSDIFTKVSQGCSCAEVAKYLNDSGYLTKNGNKFTKSSVKAIATNEIYTGKYVFNRLGGKKKSTRILMKSYEEVVNYDTVDSIISPELYLKVQACLNSKSSKLVNPSHHIYLLSGLIHCKGCGRMMVGRI